MYNCHFIYCVSTTTFYFNGLLLFVKPTTIILHTHWNFQSFNAISLFFTTLRASHYILILTLLLTFLNILNKSLYFSMYQIFTCKLKKLLKVIMMIIIIWSTFIERLLCVKEYVLNTNLLTQSFNVHAIILFFR